MTFSASVKKRDKMRVLVIGGSGFIGSHVVDALIGAGHSVRVFSRHPERFRAALPDVEYYLGDFRDRMALAKALSGIDAVFHVVSTTFPGTANLDPKTDVSENLVGTLDLIETMLGLGVKRLLFVSSGGTVYGVPEQVPIPESHALHPINSYGIVKVAIEQFIEMYRRTRGLSPVIIRASNPFGPRQGHSGVQGVVSTFIDRVVHGKEIEIWGDGSVIRDFIDVRDLAEFCVLAGTSAQEGIYNAGSGVGTSLTELLDVIRDTTKMDVMTNFKPARLIDVPVSVLDCARAAEDFGWTPRRSLRDGIADVWAWKTASSSPA
jgi:UDP-glucose 4-epimerase